MYAKNLVVFAMLLAMHTVCFADVNLTLNEVLNNALQTWQVKSENNPQSAAYARLQEQIRNAQQSRTTLSVSGQELLNFTSAPDYNTLINTQLVHSFNTPFVWGSQVNTGLGISYSAQFQPSVTRRLSPYVSLNYRQPLAPKAIAYAESKKRDNIRLAVLKDQESRDQFLRQIVSQYFSVYRGNLQYDAANTEEQLSQLQDAADATPNMSVQALIMQADQLVMMSRLQKQRDGIRSQTEGFLKKVGMDVDVDATPVTFEMILPLTNAVLVPPDQLPASSRSSSMVLDEEELAQREMQLLAPDATNSPQFSVSAYVSDEDIVHTYGGSTANILAGPAGSFKAQVTFPLFNADAYNLAVQRSQMDLDAYKASIAQKQSQRKTYLEFLYQQAMDADANLAMINSRIQLLNAAVASAQQQGTDSTVYQQASQRLSQLSTVELTLAQVARTEAYANYIIETQGLTTFLAMIGITL